MILEGASGDTALLLPGLGRCPRAGGRARRAPGHRRAGSSGDRRGRDRRSAPRGMPTSHELPFCLFQVGCLSPLLKRSVRRRQQRLPLPCPSSAALRGGSSGLHGRSPREGAHQPQPPQPWRFPCHLRPRCSGFAGCSADLLLIATTRQRFAAFSAAGASRYTFFCRPGYRRVAAACPHPSNHSRQGQ